MSLPLGRSEQLQHYEEKLMDYEQHIQHLQSRTNGSNLLTHSARTSSMRERELLRLLIQSVGQDQIRALLAQNAQTTTPEQLRRRLLVLIKSRRQSKFSTSSRSELSNHSPIEMSTKTSVLPVKKYEMSGAM